ncbi:hypothetical protein GCK32_017733, partial [Trichostrongylus colubriformis]
HSKRSDLQGIRGAAILYVLMMHLKPGIFRIGFIGVDIHSKRSDLQGIRGAAILYVLMMHLKPGIFRIGFIGVDIFFVLSGFLITKILREREFSSASIRIFYVRRFKRIVPVYMLTVVAVYIYGYFYLLYPDQMQLLRDLQWLSMYRFFVHTWSLAVELQYYSIVPAIIGSTTCFAGRWRIATFILIAVASLLFQLLTVPDVSQEWKDFIIHL